MNKSLIYRGREVEVTTMAKSGGYGFEAQVDHRSLNIGKYEGASTEQEAFDDGILFAKQHVDLLSPDGTA